MRNGNVKVLNAGVMTGTNVVNGDAFNVDNLLHAAIQAIWSAGATPVGTLKLQGSCDAPVSGKGTDVTNWSDLGVTASVSGNTGSAILQAANMGFKWLRLVYTNTSGTGTLNAFANAKDA